jgi:hypothetical protein
MTSTRLRHTACAAAYGLASPAEDRAVLTAPAVGEHGNRAGCPGDDGRAHSVRRPTMDCVSALRRRSPRHVALLLGVRTGAHGLLSPIRVAGPASPGALTVMRLDALVPDAGASSGPSTSPRPDRRRPSPAWAPRSAGEPVVVVDNGGVRDTASPSHTARGSGAGLPVRHCGRVCRVLAIPPPGVPACVAFFPRIRVRHPRRAGIVDRSPWTAKSSLVSKRVSITVEASRVVI